MDYDKLKTEVAAVLSAHPDWTDQHVADSLNEPTVTVPRSRFVTFRTLLAELPVQQAMAIITKIRAAADADPTGVLSVIRPTLENTSDGDGVDMANANAREFVDGLFSAEVLSAEEAAAIKSLAETTVSRAEQLGFSRLRAGHIREARVQE